MLKYIEKKFYGLSSSNYLHKLELLKLSQLLKIFLANLVKMCVVIEHFLANELEDLW